jgi:transposase-like protein
MTGTKLCPTCGSDHVIHVVDRDLDCVVGFKCEWCGAEWKRDLGEVLAAADPAAFDDPDLAPFPVRDPIRGGRLE